MIGQRVQAPDFQTRITAWRTFAFSESKLRSYSQDTEWQKEIKAECNLQHHASPQKDCRCGIYGWFKEIDLQSNALDVYAVCEYWGKCEAHEKGLRAEYASIKALCPAFTKKQARIYFQKKHLLHRCGFSNLSLPVFIKTPTNSKRFTYWAIKLCDFFLVWIAVYVTLVLGKLTGLEQIFFLPVAVFLGVAVLLAFDMAKYRIAAQLQKRTIQKWAQANDVIFVNDLEELKAYHTDPLPADTYLQKED